MQFRPAALLLAAALAPVAYAAHRPGADEAQATCRARAISDTSELPGAVADTDRDRMIRRCIAARGF